MFFVYELRFDDKAIEYLSKLEKETKERIFNKIILAKENPFHFFKKLENRKDYSLRVGNYRVIADIEGKVINITLIGHRRNIYDR